MQQAYDYRYLTDKSLYYLGKAYQMLGDSENAVKYYKEVVRSSLNQNMLNIHSRELMI